MQFFRIIVFRYLFDDVDVTHDGDMSYRTEEHTSRRVIDVAVGILIGLRGCSQRDAFEELVRVVNETGVGIGSIANGLVALSSGASSAGHAEAFAAWGELVGRSRLTPAASVG